MELTKEQTKQMRKVFPKGYTKTDIPALWRKDEAEQAGYWDLGEADQKFDEKENTFDEDIDPEYRREEVQNRRSPEEEAEDLEQERRCQNAQDNAIAEERYIERALEAGREEGRSITF